MSFNAIRGNKILAKISGFTVHNPCLLFGLNLRLLRYFVCDVDKRQLRDFIGRLRYNDQTARLFEENTIIFIQIVRK